MSKRVPRLVVLAILLAPALSARPDETPIPAGFVHLELPNGLEVSILRQPAATVVATQVWYHVGSANERQDERGLAHLFEHLMFGATERHDKRDYEKLHHDHGGYENAFTSPDETVYVSAIPPGPHLGVLALEADRMRGLRIEQDNLDNEKRIVTEELRLRTENDPYSRVLVAAQRALLGQHPYALDAAGRKEDVAAATVEACRRFYDAHYRPDGAHVVVVGPVEPERVLETIRREFGSLAAGAAGLTDPPPLDRWSYPPEVLLREDLPPVETAILGFPLPPPSHGDYWALRVLGQLLGGGAVDPLEEDLVKRRRKAVEAGLTQLYFRRGGAFILYSASLPYRRKATAYRLLDRARERLSALEWLGEDAVSSAKRTLLRRERRAAYFPSALADSIGRARWWHGDAGLAFSRTAMIESVTRQQVADVYRRYVGEPEPVRMYVRPERVPLYIRLFGWLYPLVAR